MDTQSKKPLGRFTFVLHSHLPYVLSHGNWPHGMVWLSEAASETYIPLWRTFDRLRQKGIKAAVTIGFSPVLAEQLADETFVEELNVYLKQKRDAAKKDLAQFRELGQEQMASMAEYWFDYFSSIEQDFNGPLNRDIIGAFRELQQAGTIEIITCGATHGYLPLLGTDEAVNAQIDLAVRTYEKHFGDQPKGIWLPECAYRPGYHWTSPVDEEDQGFDRKGVEQFVQQHGLRYFVVDSHLLQGGKAMGTYLTRFEGLRRLWEQSQGKERQGEWELEEEKEPYRTYWLDETVGAGKGDPVGILTRDPKTSLQVWSGEYGYPGDGNYLDFHKRHFPGGHRYWRVTHSQADLADKGMYDPDPVESRLDENASHFISLLKDVLKGSSVDEAEKAVVCPFDTELFGHWWFEGPRFLERVLEAVAKDEEIVPAHGGELISSTDVAPVVTLPEGSWGEGGFHYIWLNDETKWSWSLIHDAEKHMTRLVREHGNIAGEAKEMLQQLGRELLLLEASDWQFLISTIAAADYAELRLRQHHKDFEFVRTVFEKTVAGQELEFEERERYEAIKARDSLFEDLDLSMWS